jgi:hypothetical protein
MKRLVISPKYLPQLRMLPESNLSHSAALVEKWLGYYSGVDVILQNHQHSDVCRVQLTQKLREEDSLTQLCWLISMPAHLIPKMADELKLSMSKFLTKCTLDGKKL